MRCDDDDELAQVRELPLEPPAGEQHEDRRERLRDEVAATVDLITNGGDKRWQTTKGRGRVQGVVQGKRQGGLKGRNLAERVAYGKA
jgi:hypothetical protein